MKYKWARLAIPSEANRVEVLVIPTLGSQWQSLPLDAKCSPIFTSMLGNRVPDCLSGYR